MVKWFSNFQIESAIKNLNDSDLNENTVSVFPASHMSKFMDFKSLISEKEANIHALLPVLIGQ